MEGKERSEHQGDSQISSAGIQRTSAEEVDLLSIMKSLQITIPEEIEVGYQGEEVQNPEVSSPFKLLIKVASSSGTPRNIPLKALNNAMSKAWGDKYWSIVQIKPAVYRAYFKTEEDMDFVLKRQPWSVESDNLLLEWINPNEDDKDVEEYQFRYIYVPIRVYGVPEKYRTPSLMKFVIEKTAEPSDLHPPPDITMVSRKDYIQAYAKMDIQKPVKDKVKYFVSPKDSILFYLNYDKIKRICVFCGLMFHSIQNCPNRSKLIRYLQSINANTSSVPFSNIGIWTSQALKIPQEAFQQSSSMDRDMTKDCPMKIDQLPLSKLKVSEEQCGNNTSLQNSALEFNQSNTQLGIKKDNYLALKPPPCFSENVSTNLKVSSSASSQKGLKRHADAEALLVEKGESYNHSRLKTSHQVDYPSVEDNLQNILVPKQDDKYLPSPMSFQQITENVDKMQTQIQAANQVQQIPLIFSEGLPQSLVSERKMVKPHRRRHTFGRAQQSNTPIKQTVNSENLLRSPMFSTSVEQSDEAANQAKQKIDQSHQDSGKITGKTNFLETGKCSEDNEKAEAPAFKAPRAQ